MEGLLKAKPALTMRRKMQDLSVSIPREEFIYS